MPARKTTKRPSRIARKLVRTARRKCPQPVCKLSPREAAGLAAQERAVKGFEREIRAAGQTLQAARSALAKRQCTLAGSALRSAALKLGAAGAHARDSGLKTSLVARGNAAFAKVVQDFQSACPVR